MKKILVIGSSNTDMTVLADRLPAPGETVMGNEFKMGQGGKGANQAIAAKRLGGNVTFVCKVGRDVFADNSIKAYEKDGLDTSCILRCDSPSGVALITVDAKAENSIVVAGGANGKVSVSDIEGLADEIRNAAVLLLQLEIPVPAVMKAAGIAHKAGVKVVLNPAPATEVPAELFSNVDLVIPNETEISLFAGIKVTDEKTALKAVEAMRGMGVRDAVVTMGSKGCLVCEYGRQGISVPSCKVKAVDATAAGDTFCGALCVALVEGKSLEEAARFATKASAITVQRMGAQDSIPTREEVEKQ